jgi:hypothetical protein
MRMPWFAWHEWWNSFRLRMLRGVQRFFTPSPRNSPFRRKICEIRKYLRGVYLQTYGEVAERLKAAVC